MPSAKERSKATGDTHLPEIEPDEFQTHISRPAAAAMPASRVRAGWRNGETKDRDAPIGDAEARDSSDK